MRLGAHTSAAGGVSKAIDQGEELGCHAVQLFTRNQNRWESKPISPKEAERFKARRKETGMGPNMSHGSYLVNLATPKEDLAAKSIDAFQDELVRAQQIGLEYIVFHPGAHTGAGEAAGIASIASRLDQILESTDAPDVTLLLENTAGQGTVLGYTFEQLRDIIGHSSYPHRLGVCIDTCHAFAAGYRLQDREGYEEAIGNLVKAVTLEKVMAFHLNDSLRPYSSRKDRHAHLGDGELGLDAFRFLVNDSRFENCPGVLETPDPERWPQELKLLASLRG